jgi:hypothetical protein
VLGNLKKKKPAGSKTSIFAFAAVVPVSCHCNTGVFLVSGARLIALSASQHGGKRKIQSSPGWSFGRGLTIPEKVSILQRLQHSPFSILPEDRRELAIYQGGKDPPKNGDYIVEIEGYYYDYYIPPGETLLNPMVPPKPYGRTLVRLSRCDFVFAGEIPGDFADRPLVFVGAVGPQEGGGSEQAFRPFVRGLAIMPLDSHGRPDFAHAVCAPPAREFTR